MEKDATQATQATQQEFRILKHAFIETMLQKILDVLMSEEESFLKIHGQNIVFLIGRIVELHHPSFSSFRQKAYQYVVEEKKICSPWESRVSLVNKEQWTMLYPPGLWQKPHEKEISGYSNDFPDTFCQADYCMATKIMIAEHCARWNFYGPDSIEMGRVVIEARMRFYKEEEKESQLIFKDSILVRRSSQWLGFVTHIILLASNWGKNQLVSQYQLIVWCIIRDKIVDYIHQLLPVFLQNMDLWLALIMCAKILGCNTDDFLKQTLDFFEPNIIQQHDSPKKQYQTMVLWSLFISVMTRFCGASDSLCSIHPTE